jgi:hypothetical protein
MSVRAPGSAASECSPTRSSKRKGGSRRNEAVSAPTDGGVEPRRRPYSIRTWRSRLPQRASRWTGRSSGSSTFAGETSQGTDPHRKRLQPRHDEIALPAIRQAPIARFGRRRGGLPQESGAVCGPVPKHRPGPAPCGGRTGPAAPGSILEDLGFRRPSADCAVRPVELGTHGSIPHFLRRDRRWGHSIVLGSRSVRRSRSKYGITHRLVVHGDHTVRGRRDNKKKEAPFGASEPSARCRAESLNQALANSRVVTLTS